MKYVDIEPLTKEIDSLYDEWCGSSTGLEVGEEGASIGAAESIFEEVRKIIDSLQQEQTEVDLEKEIENEWRKCCPTDEGMGLESANIVKEQFDAIVYYFYKLGINARKEK